MNEFCKIVLQLICVLKNNGCKHALNRCPQMWCERTKDICENLFVFGYITVNIDCVQWILRTTNSRCRMWIKGGSIKCCKVVKSNSISRGGGFMAPFINFSGMYNLRRFLGPLVGFYWMHLLQILKTFQSKLNSSEIKRRKRNLKRYKRIPIKTLV